MATINSGNSTTLYSTTQTTTSVNTATNLPQDQVNETNFTTLYSNPTAAAQGGGTSGNLLVSGNLRVLGTSDLEGAVTIGNSYILPTSDGTTGQVVVTDGNGNLTFQNVSSISSYSIQADTTTGGADLTLVGLTTTDSVKFAEGTNMSIVRTDANTITISTVADNIPDGTAAGELLVWDGSTWTANNVVTSLVATDRLIPEFKDSNTSRTSSALFRRNYASTAYTTGLASSIAFQFDSDSQAVTTQGAVGAAYDAANPSIFGSTSIDNFTTSTVIFDIDSTDIKFDGTNLVLNANHTGAPSADVTITVERGTDIDATLTWDETDNRWEFSNDLQVGNDLTVDGGNINLNGTATAGVMPFITFATQADGVNSMYGIRGKSTVDDAWFVGSGSTGNDQGYLELATADNAGGTNDGGQIYARQYNGESSGGAPWYGGGGTVVNEFTLLNNLGYTSIPKRLGINNPNPNFELDITGTVYVAGEYKQTGDNLYINLDGANVDSYLYMKGTSKFLQWDEANQFFRFNDTVYGNNDIIAEDNLATNGNNIWFNYDDVSATDSYLTVKRGAAVDVSVRWNEATNKWQFTNDGSTYYNMVINIDDLNDVVITPPVAAGQFLVQDGTNWINNSTVSFTSTTYRPRFLANTGIYGRTASGAQVSNYTGAVAYTTGDGSSLLMGVDSDSQSSIQIGSLSTAYDVSGDHQLRLSTSTNSFVSDQATSITGSNTLVFPTAHGLSIGDKLSYASPTQNGLTYQTTYYVIATGFTTTQCQVSLTLGGSAVALTNGTGLSLWFFNGTKRLLTATSVSTDLLAPTILLNATNTGIAGVDAGLEVERGTSGTNSTFIWSETNDRWEASTDFYAPQATIGVIDINRTTGQIDTNSGSNLTLDSDGGTVFINDNLNVDAGVLYVATTGNVGINTVTPAYPLDVNGAINTNDTVYCNDVVVDGVSTYNTVTTTTTSTSATSISSTVRTTQKVVITITDNVTTEMHVLEALAFQKGTTAYLTTYAEIYSNAALATFTADVSAGSIRILATPASTNSTTFKVARISVD